MGSRITVAAVVLMAGTLSGAAIVAQGLREGATPPPAAAAHSTPSSTPSTTTPSPQITVRGCVIRFDERTSSGATKPRIHANETHRCVGVTRVYADRSTGELVIKSDVHEPIISISVSPDETMVQRGISCGASGGLGVTRISCYDRDGKQVGADSRAIYGPSANLWVGWTSWPG